MGTYEESQDTFVDLFVICRILSTFDAGSRAHLHFFDCYHHI